MSENRNYEIEDVYKLVRLCNKVKMSKPWELRLGSNVVLSDKAIEYLNKKDIRIIEEKELYKRVKLSRRKHD